MTDPVPDLLLASDNHRTKRSQITILIAAHTPIQIIVR